ncbi:FAD-dependent oxidoreductase [Paraburkholderia sp. A2WS-5]|uniref:NAD(P)/FAD-dependent oxidoreductase n=1 Tax=unclassified Paraburkholderia TaxID=2615204 RepID=UPI003B793FD4
MTSRVAVVGAGMAGVTCAQVLADAGHDVVILERNAVVGGRMCTWHGEGWQCDHGAQFFTVRDADFARTVQGWCEAGMAAQWRGRFVSFDAAGVAQRIDDAGRYVCTPYMDTVLSTAAASQCVETGQTVCALVKADGKWELTTREIGRFRDLFDAVVLAVPPADAFGLLHRASPALSVVANRARMRPCWALMLRYQTPPALGFDAAFVHGGPLRWMANDSAKPGRCGAAVWVLHASPEWSARHLVLHPEAIAEALMPAFAAFGAGLPDAAAACLWRDAEAVIESSPASRGYVWRASERVGLCGDWCSSGRVEGAWLSGRALGTAMLAALAHDRH